MRKHLFTLVLASLMGMAGWTFAARQQATQPTSNAQAALKIAIIDSRLFTTENGIQQLLQQMRQTDESFRDRLGALQRLQQQIQSLQRELQTQWANLTPQAREQKQDELEELQSRYQRENEDFQRDYERAMRRATDPIRERIFTFLASYAQARQIQLVLDHAVLSQTGAISYFDPSLDITRDFIAEYNRAHPVGR
ncbi:MAG: OmpH family outer membrane protein [Blastocatellia bacterium]|nr:OmpH family outer membrane protein [Blastocatellia bacterium]MCS7157490.1 OmpH family outer membrane protein [Blastocatellia bacterium]MDW8168394.1 OmpH family outer membrane protein [Acidobacteriota bacterium]MDW8255590.1 OmpH family outer membrane protein [Acidobacteriota bacterium]